MASSIVVDTSALMAVLLQEPDAREFAVALSVFTEKHMAAPVWMEGR